MGGRRKGMASVIHHRTWGAIRLLRSGCAYVHGSGRVGSGRVASDVSDICYINIGELTGRGHGWTVGVDAGQGCLVRTCGRVVWPTATWLAESEGVGTGWLSKIADKICSIFAPAFKKPVNYTTVQSLNVVVSDFRSCCFRDAQLDFCFFHRAVFREAKIGRFIKTWRLKSVENGSGWVGSFVLWVGFDVRHTWWVKKVSCWF